MTSSTIPHRPCSLGVSSAQAIQLTSLPARSKELSHPTQDVLLRSQFSSGHSFYEPTNSVRRAQPPNSGRVTQEPVQLRTFSSRAYQLGQKSSATQLRMCYSGVSSAQTFSPLVFSSRSPATQNDELNHSTQAIQLTSPPAQSEELSHLTQDMLLKNQFSSNNKSKPKSCPAQMFNSSYANQEINSIHAKQRERHQ